MTEKNIAISSSSGVAGLNIAIFMVDTPVVSGINIEKNNVSKLIEVK